MSKYFEAFSKFPRAFKWAIGAAMLVALYFAAIEPAIDKINQWTGQANDSESKLAAFANSTGPQKQALDTFTLGARHFGDVEFPGDPASGRAAAFNRAINKVLDERKVVNAKSRSKTAPLGNGPLTSKLGNDVKVERVVRDIEFDATPETVADVISDIEQIPVVAAVSRVQVHSIDSKDKSARLVHAVISAEAWQLAPRKG
jgi:hypothetical protein